MRGQRAKLGQIEVGEMMKADHFGWSDPIFGGDGMMSAGQWRAWQRLVKLGLAETEGGPEVDYLILTDDGGARLAKIKKIDVTELTRMAFHLYMVGYARLPALRQALGVRYVDLPDIATSVGYSRSRMLQDKRCQPKDDKE